MIPSNTLPEGYKLFVKHYRRWHFASGVTLGGLLTRGEAYKDGLIPMARPVSKGGATRAFIVEEATGIRVAEGFARCSKNDNYSKKIGRNIAVGRAMKVLRHTVTEPAPNSGTPIVVDDFGWK